MNKRSVPQVKLGIEMDIRLVNITIICRCEIQQGLYSIPHFTAQVYNTNSTSTSVRPCTTVCYPSFCLLENYLTSYV